MIQSELFSDLPKREVKYKTPPRILSRIVYQQKIVVTLMDYNGTRIHRSIKIPNDFREFLADKVAELVNSFC
ncbi:hypothetical protein pCXcHC2016_31 [Xenohaliotis phage pCXc-HC2016]|nr:hypothetical protein pCXcHC2016_31 [Xenohaliotis phage pCXc-HC2016]AQW89138.1 hypothetical protein pCXcHR2015_31 [Xenohaliotis phage pCXc-HR2015]